MPTERIKTNWKNIVISTLLLSVLAFFTYQMFRITAQYIEISDDVAFLKIKQSVLHINHWKMAFYIHVFSSIVVLLAGFTQFSSWVLMRLPLLHKGSGYLYAIVVLMIAGPSGLMLGYYANGGFVAQLSFMLLAIVWMGFTAYSIIQAIKGKITSHSNFMIRSYALTLSAITLRLLKVGFTFAVLNDLISLGPKDIYIIISWLGWVPNLLIAEMLIAGGLASRILKRMKLYSKRPMAIYHNK